jgi:DNA gyrase subunit A
MRLQKLTGLERDKIKEEYAEIQKLIEFLNSLLESEVLRMQVIKDELLEVKNSFGDERRTEVVPDEGEFNPEDFYVDEDMVVTISHLGYIKRTPVTEFRTQNRGGVGAKGSTTRDEDFLEHMFIASMHNTMLFFTENGKCFWLKVYEIPEGNRNSKGRAIQNVINIAPDDKVKAYINVQNLTDQEYIKNKYILMCTKKGIVKKTSLVEYSRPRQNGVNAITIKEGDQLLQAKLTDGKSDIILATREGKAVRFNETKVRSIGRTGAGVRGITLSKKDDEVVGMVWVEAIDNEILVVSENGYGKRSSIEDYRITNRGGKGVKTINITEKTGKLIAIKGVDDSVDLMIINKSGLTIRLAIGDLRVTGRATQGVRLINLRNNDSIAAVAQVEKEEDVPIIQDDNIGPDFDKVDNEA